MADNSAYPKVKVCGLTRAQDVSNAIEHGADYLGFIVEAKSSRRLSVSMAAKLARPAMGIVPTVAVTVNPSDDLLNQITHQMKPDYIQLHGDETPARVRDIKTRPGVRIIKAIPISAAKDLAAVFAFQADLILLDAKPPKGAARGGHGTAFDWTLLNAAPLPECWALAGGLTPENARRAARQTNAPILDVSSGVESAPGIKDASKIKAFIDAVKHGPT